MSEEVKFEVAIKRLEEIVSIFENGQASLDESLELFQEGIALVKQCEEKLKAVETKTAKILENFQEKEFVEKE